MTELRSTRAVNMTKSDFASASIDRLCVQLQAIGIAQDAATNSTTRVCNKYLGMVGSCWIIMWYIICAYMFVSVV